MTIAPIGRVAVPAKIENLEDILAAKKEKGSRKKVRTVEVKDALVDTGATFLSLPRKMIERLGLYRFLTRRAKTSAGTVEFGMYGMVQLTAQGRDCFVEVAEVPDDCPVFNGQITLESLDFVVDPVNQRLIGNPEHGGEHMFDMF
jgi:predicted aspartyl protease